TSLAALTSRLQMGRWSLGGRARPILVGSRDGSLLAIEMVLRPDEDAAKARDAVLDAAGDISADAYARRVVGMMRWLTGMRIMRGSADLLRTTVPAGQHLP